MSKNINPFCIGIAGLAGSGKDTFANYLKRNFEEIKFVHFSLAEELKNSLKSFCESNFGISPFTTDRDKKKIIRPILVEVARIKRLQTKGTYYTGILEPKVNQAYFDNKIPIISDIRYDEYPEDEVRWLKNKHKGLLFHVKRDGVVPPNEDEANNDPKLKKIANVKIQWPNLDSDKIDSWMIENGYFNLIKETLIAKAYGNGK